MITDDKLNPIENRQEKEYFVKKCKNYIEGGLWFEQVLPSQPGLEPTPQDLVREVKKLGYQKEIDTYEKNEAVELWTGNLKSLYTAGSTVDGLTSNIFYQREVEPVKGVFVDIALLYDKEYNTIRLTVNKDKSETSFVVDSKRESSRFLSGFLAATDRVKLYYTIETSSGYTE